MLEVSKLSGKSVMTCILYRSSAVLFSHNSNVHMKGSLYGLPKAAWKRDIRHACIGFIRLDWFLVGFGIRCFSSQESHSSGISKQNLKAKMEEESEAFYVVRKGDIIGIYKCLSDCQAQVSSSVCDPAVSVYKGYSLRRDSEDYLASRGFKDALYCMHAAHVKEDIFGTLVPCPLQGTAGSGDASPALTNKHCKSIPAVEAQPISCKPISCILEFDGSSKGNPGKAGAAAVLRNGDGSLVSCIREGLGIATNNVAEYRALILGMKYAHMKGFKHIQVQGDSQLICMQVQDLWQTKNQNMAALCKEVKRLKEMFQSFNIIHVKRGFNAVADNLAYSAISLPVGEVCEDCGPFN